MVNGVKKKRKWTINKNDTALHGHQKKFTMQTLTGDRATRCTERIFVHLLITKANEKLRSCEMVAENKELLIKTVGRIAKKNHVRVNFQ